MTSLLGMEKSITFFYSATCISGRLPSLLLMLISLPNVLSCLPFSVVYQLKSVMFYNYLLLLSSILTLLVSSLSLAYSLKPLHVTATYEYCILLLTGVTDPDLDPDPHHFWDAVSTSFWDDGSRFAQSEKLDHNSDPHQSRKPDPDPNPRQSEKQGAAALNGAMRLSLEPWSLIMEP